MRNDKHYSSVYIRFAFNNLYVNIHLRSYNNYSRYFESEEIKQMITELEAIKVLEKYIPSQEWIDTHRVDEDYNDCDEAQEQRDAIETVKNALIRKQELEIENAELKTKLQKLLPIHTYGEKDV